MSRADRRRTLVQSAALLGAAALPSLTRAQADVVRIICGFGAGGAIDVVARRVADKLSGTPFARSVIVDNRVGAGGRIAIDAVRTAPPDGSTLLLTPGAMLYIYPHIYRQLSYNPLLDLAPVTQAVGVPMAWGVGPMVPESVRNVPEFLAWVRGQPDKANFGTGGAGSLPHFLGAMVEKAGGMPLNHVAFKGTQAAILDMMGGQIAAVTGPEADFMPHLKGGRARLLGIATAQRTKFNPNVPTFVEQGYASIIAHEWFGFFMPARTPPETVQRAATAIHGALRDPTVVDGLSQLAFAPTTSSPAELAAKLKADFDTWSPVVKATGFTAE